MRTMTRMGKSTTTPRGTETVEFPRNLKGRLRKARRAAKPFCRDDPLFSSWVGSCSWLAEGTILEALRKRSMARKRQSPAGGAIDYDKIIVLEKVRQWRGWNPLVERKCCYVVGAWGMENAQGSSLKVRGKN
jgi:hypothetical protein